MYHLLIYLFIIQISLGKPQETIFFRDDNYEVGSPCQEPSGLGSCVLTNDCRVPSIMLKNWQPQICFFHENKTPVICCPAKFVNNFPILVTPPTPVVTPVGLGNSGGLTSDTSDRLTRLSTLKCQEYTQNYTIIKNFYGIVMGENAGIAEFPHMAALGLEDPDGNGLKFVCGGSLISERYILTAAHCFGTPEKPTMVRLGERDISTDDDNGNVRDFEIESVIKHPRYKGSSVYDDLALIRLNDSVVFTKFIRPACLYQKGENVSLDVKATGWGHTEYGGSESAILQKVSLSIFTLEECAPLFEPTRRILKGLQKTQICAGSTIDGRDTCQGDSGGPLSTLEYKFEPDINLYYIVGVTSFGKGCGFKAPAIYTRVASYIDWIEGIAWS